MSTPETPRTWTLVFCEDCGEMLGVEDHVRIRHEHFEHAGHRGMRFVEVYKAAPVDAEIERLQRAQEHEIAMRLRVERKHIPAPEHLPTPEEVNRQRERAERGDVERERLLDLMRIAALTNVDGALVPGDYECDDLFEKGLVANRRDIGDEYETVLTDKGRDEIQAALREYGPLGKEES